MRGAPSAGSTSADPPRRVARVTADPPAAAATQRHEIPGPASTRPVASPARRRARPRAAEIDDRLRVPQWEGRDRSTVHLKSLTMKGFKSFASVHHAAVRARHHRRGRPERFRQVQRCRRDRLGARRAGREGAARREDGRRHLRRHRGPAAAGSGRGHADHRQLRRRAAHRLLRGVDHPPDVPRRRGRIRDQRLVVPVCWTSRNCCPTPASAARCTSSSVRANSTRCCRPDRRTVAPSSKRPPGCSSTASARNGRSVGWSPRRPTSTG